MSNSQEPIITLTGEELKIHKIMRKKIVFGTDILGILLNKNLIKSDNIFVNKEILKYRIFQTWRELASSSAPKISLRQLYQLALRKPGTSPRITASRNLFRPKPNLR